MVPSEKKLTFTSVGTDFVEKELLGFPDRFRIIRAKAEIKNGTGTQVALSIRVRSNPTDSDDIALEYSLVQELDYQESQVVRPFKVRDTDIGKLFIAVGCDQGTNTVVVAIEYVIN